MILNSSLTSLQTLAYCALSLHIISKSVVFNRALVYLEEQKINPVIGVAIATFEFISIQQLHQWQLGFLHGNNAPFFNIDIGVVDHQPVQFF